MHTVFIIIYSFR